MLTLNTVVEAFEGSPYRRSSFRGALGKAFELDSDAMATRLVSLCRSYDVEPYEDEGEGDPIDDGVLLEALSQAGAPDKQVLFELFDNHSARVLGIEPHDEWTRLGWGDRTVFPDATTNDGVYIAEDYTNPMTEFFVTVETWDGAWDSEWEAEDIEETIPLDADPTGREPFEAAELRLLSRLGLTRKDLTDEEFYPW